MSEHTVEITTTERNTIEVVWTLTNGLVQRVTCASEHDARVFVDGLRMGWQAAVHAIGAGLTFPDANVKPYRRAK